jgi:hypothetical protein
MIRRVQTMIYGVCASCMARGTDSSLRADTNKRRGDRRPSRAIREETSR